MFCEAQFRSFSDKLKLDATRRARIESALQAFQGFSATDKQLSEARDGAPFLQGSVATKTVIRPLTDDEFDVDVIYPFRLSAFGSTQPRPDQILNWFVTRLKENAFYKANLIPKERCARIDYAADFHVDIIPSTSELPSHQPCAVPTRDLKDWKVNNPLGFVNWVAQKDTRGGGLDSEGSGYFVRSVRIVKRWRDEFFSAESAPSSMLLVTFLGNHDPSVKGYVPPLENSLFPQYQNDAAYLYDMLRLTHSCLEDPPANAFQNPSIPAEDLGRHWRTAHLDEFLSRLADCIENLRLGIWADSDASSVTYFKKAFGQTFPNQ